MARPMLNHICESTVTRTFQYSLILRVMCLLNWTGFIVDFVIASK